MSFRRRIIKEIGVAFVSHLFFTAIFTAIFTANLNQENVSEIVVTRENFLGRSLRLIACSGSGR